MDEFEEIHLLDILDVLSKRKWIIIATFVCVLTIVAFFTFIAQPIYRATAKIKIGKEKLIYTSLKRDVEYWASDLTDIAVYKTHAEMIKSFPVLYKTAKKLKLNQWGKSEGELKNYRPSLKEEIRKNIQKLTSILYWISSLFLPNRTENNNIKKQEDPLIDWANYLKGAVNVSYIRDTRIITVNVEDIDPIFCSRVANTVCESYLEFLKENRLDSFKKQLSFFSKELSKIKKRLEESEKRFYEFKKREKIFSLKGKKEISIGNLSSLSKDLIKIQVKRASLEEKTKELEHLFKTGRIEDFTPAILNDQILFSLKSQLIKAKIELEELKKTYKSKHPLIIEAKARINKIRENFIQELAKTIAGLKQQISILKREEKRLKASMSNKEKENIALSEKELKYAILKREVDTNRELYNALLTNLKELDVLKGMGEEDVEIIEKAQTPYHPVKPRPILNLVLGSIVGCMLGVGLGFFIEYMDLYIRDEKDVEKYIGLPILSVIPKSNESILDKDYIDDEISDAFLNLSINIKFYSMEKQPKTILITSPSSGEGKTSIAKNLGISLAKSSTEVLIMEVDFRNPSFSKKIAENKKGLIDFIKNFPILENKGIFNESFSFGDAQRIIFAHGKSGIMKIIKEDKKILAIFHEGRLVDIYWENRPIEERLGQLLLKQKVIGEETLKDALSLSKTTKSKMGSVLLALDSVIKERVKNIIDLHTKETLAIINSPSVDMWEFIEGKFFFGDISDDPLITQLPFQKSCPFLQSKLNSYIIYDLEMEKLSLLPVGDSVKNPMPFITSKIFEIILSMVKNKFDYIIMDGPPVFFAETIALSRYCDGIVLLLRSGYNRPEKAKKAVEILRGTGKNILGVVLNDVSVKKEGYYYYSYYPQVKK